MKHIKCHIGNNGDLARSIIFKKCIKCHKVIGNNGALARHVKNCHYKEGDDKKIVELYESGLSKRDLSKLGYDAKLINKFVKGRSISEGLKLAHKLHPEWFKLSDETKLTISKSRKEWLAKNKDKHNWRFKKESYPEKLFKQWLETLNLDIIAEYTPDDFDKFYRIDFAVLSKKIAIEINGEQHYERDRSLRPYYLDRQNYLIAKGWNVINIPAINVLQDFDNVKQQIIQILNLNETNQLVNIKHIKSHRELRQQQKIKQKEQLRQQKIQLNEDKIKLIRKKILQSNIDFHNLVG